MKLGQVVEEAPTGKRFKYMEIREATDAIQDDCWQTVIADSVYEVQKLRAAFARFSKKYEFRAVGTTFYIRKRR